MPRASNGDCPPSQASFLLCCYPAQVGLLLAGIERACLGPVEGRGLSAWMWVSWGKIAFVPTHVGDPHVSDDSSTLSTCQYACIDACATGVWVQGLANVVERDAHLACAQAGSVPYCFAAWQQALADMLALTHCHQTWASRLVYMGYGFLTMVLIFMYTAISASNLTGVSCGLLCAAAA